MSIDGSSTAIVLKRRFSAGSFSTDLRYSSGVAVPMHWIAPDASGGLRIDDASIAPSAPPAPTTVCNSSMNRMMLSFSVTWLIKVLSRCSNSPRYFVPATTDAMSSSRISFERRIAGTSPVAILCARPSTIAVFPTPDSPISAGLFFLRRVRVWMMRSISASRPMTGSRFPAIASSTRLRPNSDSSPFFCGWRRAARIVIPMPDGGRK